jgi:23S rRNA (uridine2552-2'-O)-methyltransferase
MRALEIACAVLVPGGHFVGKIFLGEDFEIARDAVRAAFEEVKIVKPPASRTESYETFLVGLRRKRVAPPAAPDDQRARERT